MPGLNAAFVNVGYEKDAFLHYLDLGPKFKSFYKYTKGVVGGKLNSPSLDFDFEPEIEKARLTNFAIFTYSTVTKFKSSRIFGFEGSQF